MPCIYDIILQDSDWRRFYMDDDTKKFLAELEAKHGGPVKWRTYATWFGSDDGTVREYGVFLYSINGTFYFEDFERMPSLLGIPLKPRKNAPPYEKYEGCFKGSDIKRTMTITKGQAYDCIRGSRAAANLNEAGLFGKLFKPLVLLVEMSDGTALFFELMDRKLFLEKIKEIPEPTPEMIMEDTAEPAPTAMTESSSETIH